MLATITFFSGSQYVVKKYFIYMLQSWFQPTDHKFPPLLEAIENHHCKTLKQGGAIVRFTALKMTLVAECGMD